MSRLWKNWLAAIAGVALAGSSEAFAAPAAQLTEIFFNPPGTEATREYVEVNITSVDAGYNLWFVALENEDGTSSDPGQVDLTYQLANAGSTGYKYYNPSGTHCKGTSSGTYSTELEGSGASYLLIAAKTTATQPSGAGSNWDDETTGGQTAKDGDLDSNIDALIASGDWVVLDAVACVAETPENDAGTYLAGIAGYSFVAINPSDAAFLAGNIVETNPSGAATFGKFAEIEYLGRTAEGAWYAANLSQNSPYTDCNWGISGTASLPECVLACNVDNPYDHPQIIANNVGSANSNTTDHPCP